MKQFVDKNIALILKWKTLSETMWQSSMPTHYEHVDNEILTANYHLQLYKTPEIRMQTVVEV